MLNLGRIFDLNWALVTSLRTDFPLSLSYTSALTIGLLTKITIIIVIIYSTLVVHITGATKQHKSTKNG